MNRTVIIYHGGGCFDGFCSAWVLSKVYPDAEFVAAKHGEPPPDVAHADVILVDFSYKRDALRRLISFNRTVTVLDHHKTAEQELAGLDNGDGKFRAVFDMTRSGGRLAWEHVWDTAYAHRFSGILIDKYMTDPNDREHPPWLVRYTEDRDLWRWALPSSRAINSALRTYPMNFAEWDRLADLEPSSLVPEGEAILRCERQVIDQHVKHAVEIDIAGHRVQAVNATTLFSEIADELAEGMPFGACYFDRGDGLRQWSLRSREGGIDVSEVARRFGGGGHPQAAGFEQRVNTPAV